MAANKCILLHVWQTSFCPSPLWVWVLPGALDSFMWRSYQASLWNIGGSTQVLACAWTNSRWVLPPPVKLECRHITFTVLGWHKTQLITLNYIQRYSLHICILICVECGSLMVKLSTMQPGTSNGSLGSRPWFPHIPVLDGSRKWTQEWFQINYQNLLHKQDNINMLN